MVNILDTNAYDIICTMFQLMRLLFYSKELEIYLL